MAKVRRGLISKISFVPIPQRSHVHYVLDLTEKEFTLPEEFPDAKDAIVKVSVKYLADEEGMANEVVAQFLKKVTPIARYLRIPERSAVTIRNRKNPSLNISLSPHESFIAYLEGKPLPSLIDKDRLILRFNKALEQIPDLVKNMERNTYTSPKIDRVLVQDFMPFQGKFEVLNLPEGLIGIAGKYQDQDGRSNRAGKSSFLDAILFSLISEYRNVNLINLIHDGKKSASVQTDLSWPEGSSKFRKIINKISEDAASTKIYLNDQLSKSMDAEIEFKKIFGMEKEDFLKTSYVRQGDLEAVFQQGATRLREDIVRWKNLQIWDSLEDIFREEVKDLTKQEDYAKRALRDAREESLVPIPSEKEMEELRADMEANRIIRDDMIALRKEIEGIQRQEKMLQRFDCLKENEKKEVELKRKLNEIEFVLPNKEEELSILNGKISVTQAKINDLLVIGKQGFDGKCPIVGIDCPGKKMVSSNLEKTKNTIYTAKAQEEKLKLEFREKKMAVLNLQEERSDIRIELGSIEKLRNEYRQWGGPTMKEIKNEIVVKTKKLNGLSHNYERLREHWERMQLDIANHRRIQSNIEKFEASIRQISEEKRYLIWLKLAVGKSGIPFQLIEDALEDIELQVNEILEELGADHRLHFESEKENRKYEAVCSYCQYSYKDRSMTCPDCSSPRQLEFKAEIRPMVVDGPRVQALNLDSGAGRALIALATRIAISRFLGASILFLDEVTGSLDPYHLGLIIRLLHKLPSLGFRQIFVISHQKEVDESIPFQIKIRRLPTKQYSTIES